FANAGHGWKAIEDGALAKRQVDLDGNVSLQNLIGFTPSGYPVAFALPYNGTDSFSADIDAYDLEGVYEGDALGLTVIDNHFSTPFRFYIVAQSETTAMLYGTYPDSGESFSYTLTLSRGGQIDSNTLTLTSRENSSIVSEGAIATQIDENGNLVPMITIAKGTTGERVWSYRVDRLPNADSESAGDHVAMDDVIYTHINTAAYSEDDLFGKFARYGQEVSDDFTYITDGTFGERCTTITVEYPYYIDINNWGSIYSMTSQIRAQDDAYTGDNLSARPEYDGDWLDSQGNRYTDEALQLIDSNQIAQMGLHKVYSVTGTVSDYYAYDTKKEEYRSEGIALLITYKSIDDPSTEYGEYEFCYIQPNPVIAHEIVGIRNTNNSNNDKRIGHITFSRFAYSEGHATNIISDLTYLRYKDGNIKDFSSTGTPVTGTGNFKYNGYFGRSYYASDTDRQNELSTVSGMYNTPELIQSNFRFFEKDTGVLGGSYASVEHNNNTNSAYTMTAPVVDVDYYIDYSNKADNLITYDSKTGKPDGYKFEFRVANLEWYNKTETNSATSYMMNNTGLKATGDVNEYNPNAYHDWNSYADSKNPTNEDTIGYGNEIYGRKVMSGWTKDPANYNDTTYKSGLEKVFDKIGNGYDASNEWQGTITFTGKNSLKKNTDTSLSAEKYANFIYEKGVYKSSTKNLVTYTGGEETYSYYNIGVSTCDKGAVRYVAENLLNKELDIVRDETTGEIKSITPVIDEETGQIKDIKSGTYSVASYNTYLAAIAEAFWFVENNHNTTYDDGIEYTTAYDENGVPYLFTDIEGDNIFCDGTTTTDPVQAQLIEDVINAYEHLFAQQDFEDARDAYQNAEELRDLVVGVDDGKFTTETVQQFTDAVEKAGEYFEYYTNNDSEEDQAELEYWRYTYLDGNDYEELSEMLENLQGSLMPVVDTEELEPIVPVKEEELNLGIYQGEDPTVQTHSLGSWNDLDSEITYSKQLLEDSVDHPKLVAGDEQTAYFRGEPYTYQLVPEDIPANYTQLQKDVRTEEKVLPEVVLVPVDHPDAYKLFDSVVAVVNSIDREKYTKEALDMIDALKAQLNDGAESADILKDIIALLGVDNLENKHVYAGAQHIERYNEVMEPDIAEGTTLLMTGSDETDPLSAALLSLIETFNADPAKYVNSFTAKVSVQYKDASESLGTKTETEYYGDIFNIDISDILEANGISTDDVVLNWSATLYGGTSNNYNGAFDTNATGSQKITGVAGTTIQRKADSNVAIAAVVLNDPTAATKTLVNILDVYGRVIDVRYVENVPATGTIDALTLDNETIAPMAIPFYDFVNWTVSVDEDGVYTAKPNYSPVPTYTITVEDGATIANADGTVVTGNSYAAKYDTYVTIDGSGITEFYAWAVKVDDQYQVASYSDVYTFLVGANEEFVAITGGKGEYYIEGAALTAAMIQNATPEELVFDDVVNLTADKYVTQKLDQKAPFVGIMNTLVTDDNKTARVYVRITEGCENISSYGVCYKNGDPDSNNTLYTAKLNNMLDSGQFVASLNSSKNGGFTSNVSFKAFVTYDFEYTFESTTTDQTGKAKINATDYTDFAVAEKKA
ncbi:MAG: hypothetical protein J1E36_04790, partial [Eubacterium sp.]|nr:hypothetical protein [Eubacterium sp.]